jgi:DNA-binding NarL/FixJ family response regulator
MSESLGRGIPLRWAGRYDIDEVVMRPHPSTPATRVLVADHDALTRRTIRLTLEREGFAICGESADAASAIDTALSLRPDICLLEFGLPGDGLVAARRITASAPAVRVLILAATRNDQDLIGALEAGASGYLLRGAAPAALARAIDAALADAVLIPPVVAGRLLSTSREQRQPALRPLRRDPDALTSREWEVTELLRDGLSTAEIANRLYISETTVRRHVSSVLRKLRVPDRAAAIRAVELV